MKFHQSMADSFYLFISNMRTQRFKKVTTSHIQTATKVAFLIAVICLGTTAFAGRIIPGIDIIIRKSPGGSIAIGQGGIDQVPADFFGPGSLPFGSDVDVDFGELLINRTLETDFDAANPADVPVELVSLSLTSVAPIEPVAGSFFDITLEMTGNGSLTLVETNASAEGGGFVVDSFFDITYQIDFVPTGGTPGGTLTLGGAVLMEFAALDPNALLPWSHFLPNSLEPFSSEWRAARWRNQLRAGKRRFAVTRLFLANPRWQLGSTNGNSHSRTHVMSALPHGSTGPC